MKRTHLFLLGGGGLVLAAVVAWALAPAPVVVETAPVTRGSIEQAIADDGRTRVRDRYVVSAPLAGRVERIMLHPGDELPRGAAVAWLTPATPPLLDARAEREMRERAGAAQAGALRARAERARAQALRDQALADRDRAVRLAAEGFVSATAREQAELALRTAERALESAVFAEDGAAHDLAQARAALGRYRGGESARWRVDSPVDGTVLKVMQESEGVVALGAPLVEIADPRSLEAVVDILSQEAVMVRPGMGARIDMGPGVPALAARVRLVEPAAFTKVSALGVEEQRVNVILDFVDPIERMPTFGDGYRVEARIVTRHVADAVKVPVGALFREGEGWAAFVADGTRARRRPVRISIRDGADALVESGLAAGERVVVYPPDSLAEGSRIEVRGAGAP